MNGVIYLSITRMSNLELGIEAADLSEMHGVTGLRARCDSHALVLPFCRHYSICYAEGL